MDGGEASMDWSTCSGEGTAESRVSSLGDPSDSLHADAKSLLDAYDRSGGSTGRLRRQESVLARSRGRLDFVGGGRGTGIVPPLPADLDLAIGGVHTYIPSYGGGHGAQKGSGGVGNYSGADFDTS